MSLHRLTSVTMGVPNVEETISYYSEFGLTHTGSGVFRTGDGGEQLRIVHARSVVSSSWVSASTTKTTSPG